LDVNTENQKVNINDNIHEDDNSVNDVSCINQTNGNASTFQIDEQKSTLQNTVGVTKFEAVWGTVTEPDAKAIYVRSKDYLETQHKQISESILFPLAHCQCFKTLDRLDHIATHASSWYHQNINPNDKNVFVIIIQIQVPSIHATLVTYHCLRKNDKDSMTPTNDLIFNKLFEKFLNSDDDFRNSRLKLIPRIAEGPFPVRKVVENRPVLVGTKVKHRYFVGTNYIEIDGHMDELLYTRKIIKLCYRFSKNVTVDLAWVLQGDNEQELPERIMAAATLHKIDFDKVPHIDSNNADYDSIANDSSNENDLDINSDIHSNNDNHSNSILNNLT